MDTVRASVLVVLTMLLATVAARPAAAQVEIETVLLRLDGVVITQLDVRRTRLLRLFQEAVTDDQVLRELENRHLILNRVSLFPPAESDALDVAARRRAWVGRLGAGSELPDRLWRAGMSEAALDAWFRDESRIAAYIELRFGAMPAEDRPAMIADWIADMRQRAGLR